MRPFAYLDVGAGPSSRPGGRWAAPCPPGPGCRCSDLQQRLAHEGEPGFDILIKFSGPLGNGWPQRAGRYQPQPRGGDTERGDGRKRGSIQSVSSVCLHGDGTGSQSGLSQGTQTAAPIHQRRGTREGRGAGPPACLPVSCSEGSRGVHDASSEGQGRRTYGHRGLLPALLRTPPGHGWEPPVCPSAPGGHRGLGPFQVTTAIVH